MAKNTRGSLYLLGSHKRRLKTRLRKNKKMEKAIQYILQELKQKTQKWIWVFALAKMPFKLATLGVETLDFYHCANILAKFEPRDKTYESLY